MWPGTDSRGQAEYAQASSADNEATRSIASAQEAGADTLVFVNDATTLGAIFTPGFAGEAPLISRKRLKQSFLINMMEGLDSSFDGVLFVIYHGSMGASRGHHLAHIYPNSS